MTSDRDTDETEYDLPNSLAKELGLPDDDHWEPVAMSDDEIRWLHAPSDAILSLQQRKRDGYDGSFKVWITLEGDEDQEYIAEADNLLKASRSVSQAMRTFNAGWRAER